MILLLFYSFILFISLFVHKINSIILSNKVEIKYIFIQINKLNIIDC